MDIFFREYYESLRILIEAIILKDGIEAESHQCKNAYICTKHPEFGLDWEFLEAIRLTRNAINYRGRLLRFEDWSEFRATFESHMKILIKELEQMHDNDSPQHI